MRRADITEFEWDKGNIDKSYQRHGITPNEAEEVFLDEHAIVLTDEAHSHKEKRLDIIGKTSSDTVLFVVFTMRGGKIRVISARHINRKERRLYEEKNI